MQKALLFTLIFLLALLPSGYGGAAEALVYAPESTPQPSYTFYQPTPVPKPTLTPMILTTRPPATTLTPVTPTPRPTPIPAASTTTDASQTDAFTPAPQAIAPQRTPMQNVTRTLNSDELLFARDLSELINSKRQLAGLDDMELDVALCLPAKQRALEALSFADKDEPKDVHKRPNGEYYNTVMYDYGYASSDYRYLIEALSHGIMYSDEVVPVADRFMSELMQPDILNNIILNPSFDVLGVGVAFTRERVRYGKDVYYSGCSFVCVLITSGYELRTPYFVTSYPMPVFAPQWNCVFSDR